MAISKIIILLIVLAYLLIINIIAFALMGIDKNKAKRGAWRISEKGLFIPVILGGGIGGVLGMKVFHHKTKHWYFAIGFPLILIIETIAGTYLVIHSMFRP